jgi:hypothetical protein
MWIFFEFLSLKVQTLNFSTSVSWESFCAVYTTKCTNSS